MVHLVVKRCGWDLRLKMEDSPSALAMSTSRQPAPGGHPSPLPQPPPPPLFPTPSAGPSRAVGDDRDAWGGLLAEQGRF